MDGPRSIHAGGPTQSTRTPNDGLIKSFETLSTLPDAAAALARLRKIANIVTPIMRTRSWNIGILSEFLPSDQRLLGLNVNHGQRICLRLRYSHDTSTMLPIEETVDTMLHELCHVVHGPHNSAFHALWEDLRDEHEALVFKGYAGEFNGQGRVLGSVASDLGRVLGSDRQGQGRTTGRRLGGRAMADRRAIADAVERRLLGSGCAVMADTSVQDAGLVEQRTDPQVEVTDSQVELPKTDPRPTKRKRTDTRQSDTTPWTCSTCTFINPPQYLICDVCGLERDLDKLKRSAVLLKRPQSLGWTCPCSTVMEHCYWTCSVCGRMKSDSKANEHA